MNFLDVTFDLHGEKHYPYHKINDRLIYINTDSNHPKLISRHVPRAVNKRLNELSSNKELFDNAKGEYERTPKESGLDHNLKFDHPRADSTRLRKQCNRKIAWFNPPYCSSLTTNLGKEFLKRIENNFPVISPLSKIINRKTVKLRYSCTSNMKQIIRPTTRKSSQANKLTTQPLATAETNPNARSLVNVVVPL